MPAAAQRQDVRPLHDMTTPLTFQGRLTLEDVLDIQHYRWRVALRPAVRVLIALVAIPIALLSVDNVYRYGLVPRNSFGMAPLSFFLLVVDTPKGVLFLAPHFRQLFWLPRRVFDDSQPKSRVLDLVAKNGVRVCTAA